MFHSPGKCPVSQCFLRQESEIEKPDQSEMYNTCISCKSLSRCTIVEATTLNQLAAHFYIPGLNQALNASNCRKVLHKCWPSSRTKASARPSLGSYVVEFLQSGHCAPHSLVPLHFALTDAFLMTVHWLGRNAYSDPPSQPKLLQCQEILEQEQDETVINSNRSRLSGKFKTFSFQ